MVYWTEIVGRILANPLEYWNDQELCGFTAQPLFTQKHLDFISISGLVKITILNILNYILSSIVLGSH